MRIYGVNTLDAATAAYVAGMTVNGLSIGGGTFLADWYQVNIVTPGHGFLVTAATFEDFSDAIYGKLYKEIHCMPEPTTMLLLGFGLIGLAGFRRKC